MKFWDEKKWKKLVNPNDIVYKEVKATPLWLRFDVFVAYEKIAQHIGKKPKLVNIDSQEYVKTGYFVIRKEDPEMEVREIHEPADFLRIVAFYPLGKKEESNFQDQLEGDGVALSTFVKILEMSKKLKCRYISYVAATNESRNFVKKFKELPNTKIIEQNKDGCNMLLQIK